MTFFLNPLLIFQFKGLEARVPFLDKQFLDVAMNVHPKHKKYVDENGKARIEKFILRKAFDNKEDPYLPDEVLWRQKEQFSDGVGYNWIDQLKVEADKHVTDEQLQEAPKKFPVNPPTTKEGYWYRTMFEELFPEDQAAKTVQAWIPSFGSNKDPSGRVQKIHNQTTEK